MKVLDCSHFKSMIVSGSNNLENKHEEIDRLNVFPVPDGDTGTNMKMTFCQAVADTNEYLNDYIGDTAKFLGKKMLMGARGNSGVILSQIFKGIAKGLDGMQKASVEDFANALLNGAKIAYKAVMRPVEGTILTVVRETAEMGMHYIENNKNSSFEDFLDYIVVEANASLQRTPDLLPVLKEVGVVDSGAAGFVTILEGMQAAIHNKPIQLANAENTKQTETGFCVEIQVELNEMYKKEFSIERLQNSLGRTCNDIKIKRDNNTVYAHVHTVTPGDILNTMQRFGDMVTIKVIKATEEHEELFDFEEKKVEHTKYAIITVCNGKGIHELFTSLGAQYIINGGQTMNPATEDFIKIIDTLNADHIIILPNNGNIILAAKQAQDIYSDKSITVVESKSIPQGITACINFNFEGELEENIAAMQEAIANIKTGSVTQAIKDTNYNSLEIHKDDFMGILGGKDVIASGVDMMDITKSLMDRLIDEDSAYVTIIYGSSTTEEAAQEVLDYCTDNYDVEGELVSGQQDLYPFIIGVE